MYDLVIETKQDIIKICIDLEKFENSVLTKYKNDAKCDTQYSFIHQVSESIEDGYNIIIHEIFYQRNLINFSTIQSLLPINNKIRNLAYFLSLKKIQDRINLRLYNNRLNFDHYLYAQPLFNSLCESVYPDVDDYTWNRVRGWLDLHSKSWNITFHEIPHFSCDIFNNQSTWFSSQLKVKLHANFEMTYTSMVGFGYKPEIKQIENYMKNQTFMFCLEKFLSENQDCI